MLSSLWHNDTVPSESVTAMISALLGCHSRSRTSVSLSLICLLLVCSSFSAASSKAKNSKEPVEVATQSVDPSFDSCGVHSMSSTAESRGTVCTCVLKRLSATYVNRSVGRVIAYNSVPANRYSIRVPVRFCGASVGSPGAVGCRKYVPTT